MTSKKDGSMKFGLKGNHKSGNCANLKEALPQLAQNKLMEVKKLKSYFQQVAVEHALLHSPVVVDRCPRQLFFTPSSCGLPSSIMDYLCIPLR